MPVAEDVDVKAFSDISDNSDIFHVEVLLDKERPCTPEDQDLARIDGVRQHLRKFPTATRRTRKRATPTSGAGPACRRCIVAFAGCTWSRELAMRDHWEMERSLHAHLWAGHRDHEMREVFAHCAGPRHDSEMTALAYYTAAICEQERRHVPLIGPAVDRRTMTLVYRVANSETIKSLMCFCCCLLYTSPSPRD